MCGACKDEEGNSRKNLQGLGKSLKVRLENQINLRGWMQSEDELTSYFSMSLCHEGRRGCLCEQVFQAVVYK